MTNSSGQSNHVIRWLIITFVLLACMAFFSALGGEFVAFFFLLALFAIWKTYEAWSAGRAGHSGRPRYERPKQSYSQARPVVESTDYGRSDSINTGKVIAFLKRIPIKVWVFVGGWVIFIVVIINFVSYLMNDVLSEENMRSGMYQVMGDQLYNNGNYDSAYYYYGLSLNHEPENTNAMFGYANCLYTRGLPDSSLYYYDRVLEVDPYFYDARYNKAWVYTQNGQYNQSTAELKSLLEDNPNYYQANQLLGDNYYAQSNYTEAIQYYKEVLLYDEYNVEVNKRLADMIPGDEGAVYRERISSDQ